ncbi:MAG: sirohydrochlorin chelatase [Candidatus Thorarchaeota archaeon]
MTTKIVLVMHGMPPKDFPKDELMEFVGLHRMIEGSAHDISEHILYRFDVLDTKVRNWPRDAENDPFWDASLRLAEEISSETRCAVVVGFNEFCAPSISDAIDIAAQERPSKIVVTTPMMTPGGEHSEEDIPDAIEKARGRFEEIEIVYAWPFSLTEVAGFLSSQIRRFI